MRHLFVVGILALAGCASPIPAGGVYRIDRPLDGICLAVEVPNEPREDIPVPAAWWSSGASGDCATRTSDVVEALGRFRFGLLDELTVAISIFTMDAGDTTFEARLAPEPLVLLQGPLIDLESTIQFEPVD